MKLNSNFSSNFKSGFGTAALSVILSFAAGKSFAQIQLPSVFTDGMVLQQNSKVNIWGWGSPSAQLELLPEWGNKDTVRVTVDSQGRWMAKVPTSVAGGPYKLKIKEGANEKVLSDIMLGEVWLCSGQSNMEWSADMGIMNGEEEVRNAACDDVRIFHMPKQGADTPQNDCRSKWETATPESMRKTSATAYFFARMLNGKMDVPVGIMVAAWGGTPAEVWTPSEVVLNDPLLAKNSLVPYPWWPIKPGVLFNQMISPMIPYTLAGCIWYQGESNHDNASSYAHLMTQMVNSWRDRFDDNFPFYYVQIAPHTYNSKHNTPAALREQQQKALSLIDNSGMINISDLVENVRDIHPRNKRAIGERLAYMVLDKEYGKFAGYYESPVFHEAQLKKDKLVVSFKGNFSSLSNARQQDSNGSNSADAKNTSDAKKSSDAKSKNHITGLEIAGADGKKQQAVAKIKGNTIEVSLKGIEAPYSLYYCFDDATVGSLRTENGIPVLPFRIENLSQK